MTGTQADAPPLAISAVGVRKSFGSTLVLDGVNLAVPEGSIFALLGPNGAGKTTIVNILSTLIPADAGQISVAGCAVAANPDGVRAAIGVTGQYSAVDKLLTGEENLRLMADLLHLDKATGKRRALQLLAQFDLEHAGRQIAATYSGGMLRRLDLAMTLVGSPRVIFLDEPTTGLDPRSRRGLWQIVRGLAASGVTIFLTTQYLEEADELASEIALLDHGRVIAEGSPDELKRLIPGGHIELRFTDHGGLVSGSELTGGRITDAEALTLQVPSDGSVGALRSLLAKLDDARVDIAELSVHTPDLDDVFLTLTGQPERDKEPVR